MSNAIPFEDWLGKQGDDVFLAMCDGHPSTIILVDKTDFAVYRYTNDKAENAKLRELAESCLRESMRRCSTCPYELTAECKGCVLHENESRLREMGVVE